MKVCILHGDKERDHSISKAFAEGAITHGHEVTRLVNQAPDQLEADVAVVLGVKARARFDLYRKQGKDVVYLDKGYCRYTKRELNPHYWRVSINGHHPTRYLSRLQSPFDRWMALRIDVMPWRKDGKHIVLAGSSAKAHRFNNIPEPTTYAKTVVAQLRKFTKRPIHYRPKPTWKEAVAIPGTLFDIDRNIQSALTGAHALVTNMSNACFEAMVYGVPSVVIGNAVAKPISSTRLEEIEKPKLASDPDRLQLLADLAYCQYTGAEWREGQGWEHVKKVLALSK